MAEPVVSDAPLVPEIVPGEWLELKGRYVLATPRQRLKVIIDRLEGDIPYSPNQIVTNVSAVEAFSRCLTARYLAKSKRRGLTDIYRALESWSPESLLEEYFRVRAGTSAAEGLGEKLWKHFRYACSYRNLLVHECTYLELPRLSLLTTACKVVLRKLAQREGLDRYMDWVQLGKALEALESADPETAYGPNA